MKFLIPTNCDLTVWLSSFSTLYSLRVQFKFIHELRRVKLKGRLVDLRLLRHWLSCRSHFTWNRLPQIKIHLIKVWLFPQLQNKSKQSEVSPCCATTSAFDSVKSTMCSLGKWDSESLISQLVVCFFHSLWSDPATVHIRKMWHGANSFNPNHSFYKSINPAAGWVTELWHKLYKTNKEKTLLAYQPVKYGDILQKRRQ